MRRIIRSHINLATSRNGIVAIGAHIAVQVGDVEFSSALRAVAIASAWADYARQLGAAADACALADPLLRHPECSETLEGVPLPAALVSDGAPTTTIAPDSDYCASLPGIAQGGTVQLTGDLSSRHGAVAGLTPVTGALVGAPELRLRDIQDRVRGRYPEATALPAGPS